MNSEYKLDAISEIMAMIERVDIAELRLIADMVSAHADVLMEVKEKPRHRSGQRVYQLLSVIMDDPIIIGHE